MATPFTVTVRDDGPRSKTVIFHDKDGNELGGLTLDSVPTGIRVDGWSAKDYREHGQIIVHDDREEQ